MFLWESGSKGAAVNAATIPPLPVCGPVEHSAGWMTELLPDLACRLEVEHHCTELFHNSISTVQSKEHK